MLKFFCRWCGIELDEHDADNNIASWDVFALTCSDYECCLAEDMERNPNNYRNGKLKGS